MLCDWHEINYAWWLQKKRLCLLLHKHTYIPLTNMAHCKMHIFTCNRTWWSWVAMKTRNSKQVFILWWIGKWNPLSLFLCIFKIILNIMFLRFEKDELMIFKLWIEYLYIVHIYIYLLYISYRTKCTNYLERICTSIHMYLQRLLSKYKIFFLFKCETQLFTTGRH